MFITTHQASGTNKAAVRGKDHKVLYTASSTESERRAALAVVLKYWTQAAADSVRELKDPAEIASIVGNIMKSPHRKQVFRLWAFNENAR